MLGRCALDYTRSNFLKERPFGLTNGDGNHGEDVQELDDCRDAVFRLADAVPRYARAELHPH
jgi:hypothetical protein